MAGRGEGLPAFTRSEARAGRPDYGYRGCGGIPGSSSALSNSRLARSPTLRDARLLLALASGSSRYRRVVRGSSPGLAPRGPRAPLLLGSSVFPLLAAAACGCCCGQWPDCDCGRWWWRRPPTHPRCSIYRAPGKVSPALRATPRVSSSRLPGCVEIKGPSWG